MRTVINHRPRPPMCFILPGLRPLRLALRPFAIGLLLALRRQAELFLCLVLVFMNRDSQTQIVKFGFVSIDWHQLIIGSSPNQAQTQSNKILKADSLSILLRNDRGGTRTLDPRINLPHRLSPASKFYSCWFTAKRNLHVESLDYIITISGVSRLVSEADSLEAEGTSPADHPILTAFHAFAVIVTDPAVACEAVRAFQQFATCTSNGWFISVEGSHYRLTPTIKVRCSTN